jgi:alkanesulfonate monooxygenase SsuD/methylene tetrahydromethanopterin reductase-like flavin-dependent oxidoreductase (luciferase family)
MVRVGMLLSDVPTSQPPADQLRDVLRIVEAAEDAGFSYFAIGQHFMYGDLRWLQPVPLLARLAAHTAPTTRLATQIIAGPLYHPVLLAEEIATLDVVTEGRLDFGVGLGYRKEEFDMLGIPHRERAPRLDEMLELLPLLWTQDEVTFSGRFWQLEGVRPHIRPVQDPHPPIWVGANAEPGVRRAGRFGDAYACPPKASVDEVARRFRIVQEEFALRGKRFGPQPLRREVSIGDTEQQAIDEYVRVAKSRYVTYSQRGNDVLGDRDLDNDFFNSVKDHVVYGTPESVTQQLVDIVTTLPVDPLLLRPQWPTMGADETIAVIERLGKDVVPTLAAIPPSSEIRG